METTRQYSTVPVLNDGNGPVLLPSNPASIPILTIAASFELRTDAISSSLGILLGDSLLPNDHLQDDSLPLHRNR